LGHSVVSTRCCGYTCLFFGGLNTSQSCCGVFATLETLHKTLNFLTYLHCTYATDILSSKIEHHPALLWRFASLAPLYTVNHKKLGHFYFYCNFGKCWSIFKILSLSESERNGS